MVFSCFVISCFQSRSILPYFASWHPSHFALTVSTVCVPFFRSWHSMHFVLPAAITSGAGVAPYAFTFPS